MELLLAALAPDRLCRRPGGCTAAAETAETAEMTAATETEETAAQPVGFTVGNLSEVPNTCGGGYWGWNTGDAYYELHGWMMKMARKACTPCC